MGHKIFVSYKYADYDVANRSPYENSKVRDYVDEFEDLLDSTDHIYKGEHDGEDLSQLSDETIWKKLKDRIYDSTLTVVFISPGIKRGVEARARPVDSLGGLLFAKGDEQDERFWRRRLLPFKRDDRGCFA